VLFICSGCSAVQKTLFLKPIDKSENWDVIKYKSYSRNFFWEIPVDNSWSDHLYYSCDTTSSIVLYFSPAAKCIFIGPPIVPIFPMFLFFHIRTLDVRVLIKTGDFKEIENLSKQFHFYFNDSLNFTEPASMRIMTKYASKGTKNDVHLCSEALTSEYFSIILHFNLEPYKLKNVSIKFDDEFNKQLKSNYKTLSLSKKSRLHYSAMLLDVY
jgi:hypothetical protein